MKIDVVLGEDKFSKGIAEKLDVKFVKINSTFFPDSEVKPIIKNEEKIEGKKV